MQVDVIREAIGCAAESVLETMFFTIPEREPEPRFPADAQVLHAAMTISGEWAGTFELNATLCSARAIAGNFLGAANPGEVSDQQVGEVISELTNMICGSTLSRLDGEKIFDLGSPRVWIVSGASENEATLTRLGASCGIDLGDGIMSFALAVAETP